MRYFLLLFVLTLAIYQYYFGNINIIERDKNKSNQTITNSSFIEIPSISLTEYIYFGYSESLLDKGMLMEPESIKSNNVVMYGHRFSINKPFRKYLIDLDKVKIGDLVTVSIENKKYEYLISSILEVTPQETWVLSETRDKWLTIITCTPAYNPKNRLVVISKLVRKY